VQCRRAGGRTPPPTADRPARREESAQVRRRGSSSLPPADLDSEHLLPRLGACVTRLAGEKRLHREEAERGLELLVGRSAACGGLRLGRVVGRGSGGGRRSRRGEFGEEEEDVELGADEGERVGVGLAERRNAVSCTGRTTSDRARGAARRGRKRDAPKRERGQVTQRGSRNAKRVPRVLAASTTRYSARSTRSAMPCVTSICRA